MHIGKAGCKLSGFQDLLFLRRGGRQRLAVSQSALDLGVLKTKSGNIYCNPDVWARLK